MRVLALDTSTRDGSVALIEDDRVIVERVGDATRPQAERLPGDLLACLQAAECRIADVDLYAIGAGPGSFTGLRIGIAALQGFALVTGRRLAAISLLDVLGHVAAATRDPGVTVGVWIDAYRHEVFTALYRVNAAVPFTSARLQACEPARVDRPAAVVARWQAAPPAVVIGNGAVLYREIAETLCPAQAPPPLAAPIGRLAIAKAHLNDTLAPASVQPLYVRRPDVEIAREQRRHA
jgi:tRNA threonylcarbamoyladenosine biosynthesis protein TsaB